MLRAFHLPNKQSHLVLSWLLEHCAGGELDRLIAGAFDRVAENEHAGMERYDDYALVSEELAEALSDWFDRRFAFLRNVNPHDRRPGRGLLEPLLQSATDVIDWLAVAEGLLRMLGKFNPENEDLYPLLPRDAGDDADGE